MTEQDDEASLPQSVRVITTLSHGVLCGYKEGGGHSGQNEELRKVELHIKVV